MGVSYNPSKHVQVGELEIAMALLRIHKTALVYTSKEEECMVFQYASEKTCIICAAVEILVHHEEEYAAAMYGTNGLRVFCEDCGDAALSTDAHVLMACMFAGGKLSLVSHAHLMRGTLNIEHEKVSAVKSIIRCLISDGIFDVQSSGVMKMWEDFAKSRVSTMYSLHSELLHTCQDSVAFARLLMDRVTGEDTQLLENLRHK
eukprot:1317039-Pleurochrysis_carterae.AAC.1